VTHVFVSPHPDDVALSCGGLIASLRARGENVTIVTVHGGAGSEPALTPYQVQALGFDDGRPIPTPDEAMGFRRAEDEAYGRYVGATMVQLLRPDGVFRGYTDNAMLSGEPLPEDPAPVEALRRALAAAAPERLYLPLAVGGHVDHQQTRRAGIALLAEAGSPYRDRTRFFEDFPYAFNHDFERLDQLPADALAALPGRLEAEYFDVTDWLDRKIAAIESYASQLGPLFDTHERMIEMFTSRAGLVGRLGGVGPSERYWRLTDL
jgi:LmbE family N-acetylglucosaminyl deacetylase